MTDHEKDHEAVAWLESWINDESAAFDLRETFSESWISWPHMRSVLTLAREALAMREQGPVTWVVVPEGETIHECLDWEGHPTREQAESYVLDDGGRIIPLYAGEPVEVDE